MAPPIATTTIPTGGLFSIKTSTKINASATKIYNTILDTSTWPDWNTFIPAAAISSQPKSTPSTSSTLVVGTKMNFTVHMSPNFHTKNPEEVTTISPAPKADDPPGTKYSICWCARGMPGFMLKGERVNEIVTTEDPDVCEYITWETFGGTVAYAVRWQFEGTLQERFEDWTRDLKGYCEK